MTTSALKVDTDILNDLLSNQKRLDDMLLNGASTDLDEDSFFSSSYQDTISESSDIDYDYDYEDLLYNTDDTSTKSGRGKAPIIIAVIVEFMLIYFGIVFLVEKLS